MVYGRACEKHVSAMKDLESQEEEHIIEKHNLNCLLIIFAIVLLVICVAEAHVAGLDEYPVSPYENVSAA